MTSLTSRTRLLSGLLGLALAAGIALNQETPVWAPFQDRVTRAETLQAEQSTQRSQLDRHQRQAKELGEWIRKALPFDESEAAAIYYPYIASAAASSGLTQVTISPPSTAETSADARWMTWTLTAEATTDQWAAFVHRFRHAARIQRIAQWDLEPSSGPLIRGHMVLEAACLRGATGEEPAQPTTLADAPATLFGSRNWFQDRRMNAQPVSPAEEAVVADEKSPEPEANTSGAAVYLVGTLSSRDHAEAWFYDRESHRNVILVQNREFELLGRHGTVLAVDRNSVTLQMNGRDYRVRMGEEFPKSDLLARTAP